jgi:23S rRNA pseudouridine1911/1915/1917 synthase
MCSLLLFYRQRRGVPINQLIKAGSPLVFIATNEEQSKRLDVCLAHRFPAYSRSFFHRMIVDRLVSINGALVTKTGAIVRDCDEVTLTFPVPAIERREVPSFADKEPITIIFEHEHFFILDKPAGWIVHAPHAYSKEVTVVDWLLAHYQELRHVGIVDRPGIVHRLDKDTSGLLIIARTNYAHQQFGQLFHHRDIAKTYLALVQGRPSPDSGSIDLSITRDMATKVKMRVCAPSSTGARKSLTHYAVVASYDDYSLLECRPVTGRTHQIRVHCAAIGHPLLGDELYGQSSPLMKRHALHAARLEFIFDGVQFSFSSPLPADMAALVALQ